MVSAPAHLPLTQQVTLLRGREGESGRGPTLSPRRRGAGRWVGLICAVFLVGGMLIAISSAKAAGFQYAQAPDPDSEAIDLAIWYPSDGKATTQPLGLFTQDVAY